MASRIVITGGAGFIGSHLVDAFLARGDEVLVVDDLSSGDRARLAPGARLVERDIRDVDAARAITDFAPTVLVHEAAQIDVRKSVEDWPFDVDVNVRGLVVALEAARRGGRLAHVLFASSGGAIYGEQERFPADERHPIRPVSPYGLAKWMGEEVLALHHRMHGVTATSLRYANVYGPRQSAHGEAGVVAIFTGRLLRGEPITVYGGGAQTRDFVFVDDVVRANLAALEQRTHGPVNVGTGRETSVNDLVDALARATGTTPTVVAGPARAGEQARSVVDPARLARALGVRDLTSLDDGLARTVAWFRDQG